MNLTQPALLRIGMGLFIAAVCAVIAGCAAPAMHPDTGGDPVIYVIAGDRGQSEVRAVIAGGDCPVLIADGAPLRMQTRAAPQTLAQRPTQSQAALSKPSAFPVRVCEASLAPSVHSATVLGRPVPLMKAVPRRIVVIGDTGCRIKASDNAVQDCLIDKEWPFPTLASKAATERPDLVVHVGDYHYRETACPPGRAGCAGSPWGYGWDAWDADLFAPASQLLAAAPWVVARGNHEECLRAGQGWFRLLEPRPFAPQRSCDQAVNDDEADFSEPYAVALGEGWQLIVFDSARAGNGALKPANVRDANIFAHYQKEMQTVAALAAAPGMHSIFISHHPVLGLVPANTFLPHGAGGNLAMLAVMKSLNGNAYYPPQIAAAMHGHVHVFEALAFTTGQPPTIVAGHGGDTLDNDLPEPLPAGASPAEGVSIGSVVHSGGFGYLVMDRKQGGWQLSAKRLDGAVLVTCELTASGLTCDRQGAVK
ncbi:MAG: metallophosphoesterase [Burkholderiaceae bacterium]|nr:metallophosphoesterase [Burkholderiaceae bacterium]